MKHSAPRKTAGAAVTLLTVAVVIAGLYLARQILVPATLAILMTFLLAPIVRRVEYLRIGRVGAVVLVVALAVGMVGALGWVLEEQAYSVASQLPGYRDNILKKLAAVRPGRESVLNRASRTIVELGQEMSKPSADGGQAGSGKPSAAPATPDQPLPVKVMATPMSPYDYARSLIGPTIVPLSTFVIVVVLSSFMLVRREDLRDRVLLLLGTRSVHLSTPALDDAAQRVSRYLLLQSAVNIGAGVLVGVGLLILGVPGALLWGILAGALRFVPYVGAWIAGVFPFLLSLAVAPDWTHPMLTAGLIIAVELIAGNIVEPLVFSSKVGLSSVAIVASTLFWAWLWGPVGLLLSTPLTVCLAVLGRHIPRFAFLEVLLADKVDIPAEARLYQRLLAGDQEEADEIVAAFSKGKPLSEVYDTLVLPAMRLAEADRHRNELSVEQIGGLLMALETIIDDHDPPAGELQLPRAPGIAGPLTVVCVPARDAMDSLSARMLAQVLTEHGASARALSSDLLTGEVLECIGSDLPSVVCVCAVPPDATVHARVMCKRIRSAIPDVPLVVGLWNASAEPKAAADRLGSIGTEYVATTMGQAAAIVPQIAGTGSPAGTSANAA